ncbi:hypothetical protein P8629_05185 [Hydrogenovibrio sp. 3SP14C1]|uniref:hypothetical protein n=1 Tax=Hydrogenovibrio sp. 3SP14C1 TaxID=3038774 RepID=UPI0024172A08|nr:hypothetical protein [Hydrogenovibrio sp. 3SP14C1]MDG4812393.1 hypothetical protein [Hydrogenovibrio sp. 3SP14C1]
MSKVTLSEFIISVVELLEAQFEEMRLSLHKSAWSLAYILISSLLVVFGFLFSLWGVKLALEEYIGDVGSYFVVSVLTFILSFIVAKVAAWVAKK